jgi:phage terminase small subunit
MGARGKKPENLYALDLPVKSRPKPPKNLPKRAKAVWKDIVDTLPADHFRKSELPLLVKYCMAEHIYWQAIEKMSDSLTIRTEKGYELPDTYLIIANKQVQIQTALATKLRICTNARISKAKVAYEKEEPERKRKGLMFGGKE